MYVIAASALSEWENFYVIVGSAAAALIGLMFVAMTLIAGSPNRRSSQSTSAFSTPTIIHFSAALTIAALVSAPWPALWLLSLPLGIAGLGGFIYAIFVMQRIRQRIDYQPVLEDWVWNCALPLLAYVVLGIAALLLPSHAVPALFALGGVTLLLLFTGIHNAWDVVTYIAIVLPQVQNGQSAEATPAQTSQD